MRTPSSSCPTSGVGYLQPMTDLVEGWDHWDDIAEVFRPP